MTKKQKATISRNWKIVQLRAILPRLATPWVVAEEDSPALLNKEFTECLTLDEYATFIDVARKMFKHLNAIKVIRFLCEDCVNHDMPKRTSDKKAVKCDRCGAFAQELYLAPKNKKEL